MKPSADTLVTPNIRLVRELGRGSMGSVWLAEHLTLRTQVAVKFILEAGPKDEAALTRFSREATAAARIHSPHVAQVFDHGETDGVPYIVMELLEGEDLGARLRRRGRLSAAETTDITRQIAKALAKAHSIGVVHRDVKPENVFLIDVVGEIFVKVLDFGLAKQHDDALGATRSHTILGTPYYMSPEQAESARRATAQSDLWSLGVVVYRCLTGVLPFDGDTVMGLCIAISEAEFQPPSRVQPDLPREVDAWCARALSRDPAARFASALEMSDALAMALGQPSPTRALEEDFAATHAPVAPSATRNERSQAPLSRSLVSPRAARSMPLWAKVATAALALGAAGAAGALLSSRHDAAIPTATTPQETASAKASVDSTITPPVVDSAASAVPSTSVAPTTAPTTTTTATTTATMTATATATHSTAPLVAPSASPDPVRKKRVRLGVRITHDLYDRDFMAGVVSASTGAIDACIAGQGQAPAVEGYNAYVLRLSADGAVASVAPANTANWLDACALPTLRGLRFGRTQTGAAGEIVVNLSVR